METTNKKSILYISGEVTKELKKDLDNWIKKYDICFIPFSHNNYSTSPVPINPEIPPHPILLIILEYYNISYLDFYTNKKCRKREWVILRQKIAWMLNKYSKLSLLQMGIIIGNKNHATVIWAVKTINNLCDSDKEFKKEFEELENHVENILLNPVKSEDEILIDETIIKDV